MKKKIVSSSPTEDREGREKKVFQTNKTEKLSAEIKSQDAIAYVIFMPNSKYVT